MQRNKDKAGDVGLRREERSTRGKRMRAALEDESEGDQEFWNQEFWAEEAVDEDFKSEEEKEEEDVPDSDFDEPEEEDEDEEVEEKPMKDDAPKRKAPKAPEIKAPPRPRAPPKPKPTPAEREAQAEAKLAALEAVEAPTLRKWVPFLDADLNDCEAKADNNGKILNSLPLRPWRPLPCANRVHLNMKMQVVGKCQR
ncbi:YL1 nuclear protein-domain-containing protein [Dunaliella salina]|uniref:YL1 nuclear protein-domain-containing protein n=1 Tax=Dunaliella salina TaxID=3046 RepID=A0ABQ7GZM7_DUNSA|nr:YL1 nuclear protein-domain-containing protein [Dunaliella salina]|eukprot:KAF5840069.1 YL1 nuclear protein-domain-containing protein [Dunaliella salina]